MAVSVTWPEQVYYKSEKCNEGVIQVQIIYCHNVLQCYKFILKDGPV